MPTTQTTEPIDTAALRAMIESATPVTMIDVRTPGEFESAHITGAYNVPLDTLGEHRQTIASAVDNPVVLVCQSGNRASQAESRLAEAGMSNVRVLRGGMNSWLAAGAPAERGRQRWGLERQVRLVAGAIVAGSVLASIAVPGLKWVAAAVGAGLAFAAVTDTCAMGVLLSKLPYNQSASCDVGAVVAQLTGERRADRSAA